MTYLFLGSEWADVEGRELVSLALIGDDGMHEFCAEIDLLPKSPTDFSTAIERCDAPTSQLLRVRSSTGSRIRRNSQTTQTI